MGVLSRNLENFRFWGFRRFGKRSEVKRQNIFVVVFQQNESAALRSQVERDFAFSSSSERLTYQAVDTNLTAEQIIEMSPARVLFVNCPPLKQRMRALKYLDVPYAILKTAPDTYVESDVASHFPLRGGISEVVGRRNSVYVHKPHKRNLLLIAKAFLEAKRQYPDLLLMISGTTPQAIEALGLDLSIIEEDASKSRRQLGDVLISNDADFSPSWAASANLCVLLPESKDVLENAKIVLGSGASLLTYQVDLEEYDDLFELEAIGAIWSAQRPNLLAASMTQALSPEKSALTVGQSLSHLTATDDKISQAIDALLDGK